MTTHNNQSALFEALVETDRAYFRAAAQRMDTYGFDTWWMPDFRRQPAGCTAFALGAQDLPAGRFDDAVADLEAQLSLHGIANARIYETSLSGAQGEILLARGYQRSIEHALAVSRAHFRCELVTPEVLSAMRWLRDDADWALKTALHAQVDRFPDGHDYEPGSWESMERAKCVSGYMDGFVLLDGGPPDAPASLASAAVNTADSYGVMRLKNLFVSPLQRGRSLGRVMTQFCIHRALEHELPAFGCFGITGSAGSRVYAACGLHPVGDLIGWSKPLDSARPTAVMDMHLNKVPAQ